MYNNIFDGVKNLVQIEGISGLYKGFIPMLAGSGLY